jgi:hypothetical protein
MRSQQTKKESPVNTSTPAPVANVAPAPSSGKTSTPQRSPRSRRRRTILMAGIALSVVATTVIARYASLRAPSALPIGSPDAVTVTAPPPAPAAVVPAQPPAPDAVRAVADKPRKTPAATTAHSRAHSAPAPAPTVAAASSDGESASKTIAAEPITSASTVESTATSDAVGVAPVTITGCLETTVDGGEFRLTDTEGVDVPKARSWRSGFLKKRAAPVALVELSDPKGLQKYVGRRVVATGQLTSRELHVRSLQPAGASCRLD